MPRFSQSQLDAAEAVIALSRAVAGGELTIDEIANVVVEKVHQISMQSVKCALVNVLLAVSRIEEENKRNEERKRRNSHA